MKNLIIGLSSLFPQNLDVPLNLASRQRNYAYAIKTLLKNTSTEDFDIVYLDNTIKSVDELSDTMLKEQLSKIDLFLTGDNQGTINKGAGEHAMLSSFSEIVDYSEYEWVIYFTGRYLVTCPWFFNKTLDPTLTDKDAIVSRPEHIYLDLNRIDQMVDWWYSDAIFAMKSDLFQKFVPTLDANKLTIDRINSEEHLLNFLVENESSLEILDTLGLARYDNGGSCWHII